MRKICWILICGLFFLASAGFGASDDSPAAKVSASKVYFPGDVVQIVVQAPPDTVKLTAEMPDNNRVDLDFERKNYIWRGFWEVPLSMKKGIYTAKLTGLDVEGKTFQGTTAAFMIGRPTMVIMIDKTYSGSEEPTAESRGRRQPYQERADSSLQDRPPLPALVSAAETAAKGNEAREENFPGEALEEVGKDSVFAAPLPVISSHEIESKDRVEEDKKKTKKMSDQEEARIISQARYYLVNQDYEKAKKELNRLLLANPNNEKVKTLSRRVDELMKIYEQKD